MGKLKMNTAETMNETFERFMLSKQASGITDKALKSYRQQFQCLGKYMDGFNGAVEDFTEKDLAAAIERMKKRGLAERTIKSYIGVVKTFFGWCNEDGINTIFVKAYKAPETIKQTYTDGELASLLKKPNVKKCAFSEYRNWVIVNFLMNSGCRAATIRNIQIRDVDMDNRLVQYRHTKNKKAQIIPLCEAMKYILLEYMKIRGGSPEDYLFPNDRGEQMSEGTLANAIRKYNRKRGVLNGSIHSFRHTFARKYLLDCGGNAFTLQKLLGHSTLDMTRHYCAIFNTDITKNYDEFSPLTQLTKGQRISMK